MVTGLSLIGQDVSICVDSSSPQMICFAARGKRLRRLIQASSDGGSTLRGLRQNPWDDAGQSLDAPKSQGHLKPEGQRVRGLTVTYRPKSIWDSWKGCPLAQISFVLYPHCVRREGTGGQVAQTVFRRLGRNRLIPNHGWIRSQPSIQSRMRRRTPAVEPEQALGQLLRTTFRWRRPASQ